MTAAVSRTALLDALAWQVELGASDAVSDAPIDRTALPDRAPWQARPAPPPASAPKAAKAAPPPQVADVDPVDAAEAAAGAAQTLEDLRAAMEAYPHCALKQGARQLVFCDGRPGARVMIVGEAPGREEDEQGKPFVGRAGRLLDRMFAPIGLSRESPDLEHALYITNILPWRPPQNRDPKPDEIAMMKPFLARHVALAAPEVLIAMGNISCQAMLGRRGITRLRGTWTEAVGLPCLPMFHPAYLLRNPSAKREAWADLLDIAARLEAP